MKRESKYKIIGSGFIYQEDEDIFNFLQQVGGKEAALALGAEGLEQAYGEFKKMNKEDEHD